MNVKLPSVESAGERKWTEIIEPTHSLFDLKLKDVWQNRYLLSMFVRRDFVANYKQTILGPLWFFIQPLLTSVTFLFIFNKAAGIKTGVIPPILFYLAGLSCWNYFSECMNKTATVFKDNAGLFGKVYFPRLIVPLSIMMSNLIRFGIQFLLFVGFYIYYLVATPAAIHPTEYIFLLPVLLILMAGFGLGLGMIISALTSKYRDLIFLMAFGTQLLMYVTPVIYPLSLASIPDNYRVFLQLNPLAPILETFRFAFFGEGSFSWGMLGYSAVWMIVLLCSGILIFNKVEKTFMDTV